MSSLPRHSPLSPEERLGIVSLSSCLDGSESGWVLMPIADCISALLATIPARVLHLTRNCARLSPFLRPSRSISGGAADNNTTDNGENTNTPPTAEEEQPIGEEVKEGERAILMRKEDNEDAFAPLVASHLATGLVFEGTIPCFAVINAFAKMLTIVRTPRPSLSVCATNEANETDNRFQVLATVQLDKDFEPSFSMSFPFNVLRHPSDPSRLLVSCPQTKQLATFQLRKHKSDGAPPVEVVRSVKLGEWPLGLCSLCDGRTVAIADCDARQMMLYDAIDFCVRARVRVGSPSADDDPARPVSKPWRLQYWPREDAIVAVHMSMGAISILKHPSRLLSTTASGTTREEQTPPPSPSPVVLEDASQTRGGVFCLAVDPFNGDLILCRKAGTVRVRSVAQLEMLWGDRHGGWGFLRGDDGDAKVDLKKEEIRYPASLKLTSTEDIVFGFI